MDMQVASEVSVHSSPPAPERVVPRHPVMPSAAVFGRCADMTGHPSDRPKWDDIVRKIRCFAS